MSIDSVIQHYQRKQRRKRLADEDFINYLMLNRYYSNFVHDVSIYRLAGWYKRLEHLIPKTSNRLHYALITIQEAILDEIARQKDIVVGKMEFYNDLTAEIIR